MQKVKLFDRQKERDHRAFRAGRDAPTFVLSAFVLLEDRKATSFLRSLLQTINTYRSCNVKDFGETTWIFRRVRSSDTPAFSSVSRYSRFVKKSGINDFT